MAREMSEEKARRSIVRFCDNSKDDKGIFYFGIDIGPGLPKDSRLVSPRLFYDGSVQQEVILLDESNPFVVVQKISFADFLVRASRVLDEARRHRLIEYAVAIPNLSPDSSLSEIDFGKDADVIVARLESARIHYAIDWLNSIIEALARKGVTEF